MSEIIEKAYSIINENYHKKNGVGEYDGIENRNESFLDIDYIIRTKKERDFIKLSNAEVHTLVLAWQETNDDLIATALLEHYLLLIKKLSLKYAWAYNNLQMNREGMDSDLVSEAYLMLHKCMGRFKLVEGGTFTAYFCSELRNHYIETARKSHFSIAKMPSSVFREMRRKIVNNEHDDYAYIKRAFDTTSSKDGDTVELDLISTVADPSSGDIEEKIIENSVILDIYKLARKKFDEREVVMFILYSGVYKPYTQKKLAEMFEISPSAVGKKVNAVKAYLAQLPETRNILTNN
ncbi:MAG: sigma-70 family RNA polymerase sigma factor [Bacteroidales bacterium]